MNSMCQFKSLANATTGWNNLIRISGWLKNEEEIINGQTELCNVYMKIVVRDK